jgi:glycosyltransferase involved in cell wall biosynthesis
LKVLLSAFSCEPWRGSEPEVGFRTLLAAAERHEVWVLTSATGMPALARFLADHPLSARIHPVPYPAVRPGKDEGNLGLLRFHRVYDRWQRRVTPMALDLDRRINFDLVHHVTIATVWTRTGAAAVPKPLVWGPVGGGVDPPLVLARELGWRGAWEDIFRIVGRRLLTRLPHARLAPRHAVVTFAQNHLTARTIRTSGPVSVLTNGAAVDVSHIARPRERTSDLVFIGRLLPWKGTMLALRAFSHVSHPHARLRFFGAGPDLHRLERAARRWSLGDRVRFEGWRRRDTVLAELASSAALVYPSLHDEAGLSVAEALSLGTPAICLDHGGPAEVVRYWPEARAYLVEPGGPEVTARRLAAAMEQCLERPAPVSTDPLEPDLSFRHKILDAYEEAVSAAPTRFRLAQRPSPEGTPSAPRAGEG